MAKSRVLSKVVVPTSPGCLIVAGELPGGLLLGFVEVAALPPPLEKCLEFVEFLGQSLFGFESIHFQSTEADLDAWIQQDIDHAESLPAK